MVIKLRNRQFKKASLVTATLLILTIISVGVSYAVQLQVVESFWVTVAFPILTAVLVLGTDVYMLLKMNQINNRKIGLKYLGLCSIVVILFQVSFDLLLSNPTAIWHLLIYDAMFNISFCMLFIVTFKFTDVYTLRLARYMDNW